MLHLILANNTWYRVTNPNTFDSWGQKCFQAEATGYADDKEGLKFYPCENGTFIPVSTIQKIVIKKK